MLVKSLNEIFFKDYDEKLIFVISSRLLILTQMDKELIQNIKIIKIK